MKTLVSIRPPLRRPLGSLSSAQPPPLVAGSGRVAGRGADVRGRSADAEGPGRVPQGRRGLLRGGSLRGLPLPARLRALRLPLRLLQVNDVLLLCSSPAGQLLVE